MFTANILNSTVTLFHQTEWLMFFFNLTYNKEIQNCHYLKALTYIFHKLRPITTKYGFPNFC
jgi:hypothetical protein